MKYVFLPMLAACTLVSCEKAKDFAARARHAVQDAAGSPGGADDGKPDPELQALVDESPEGFLFRKDLPFPASVEVSVSRQVHYRNAKVFQNSALGAGSEALDEKQLFQSAYVRAGDEVRITLESAERIVPDPEDSEKTVKEKIQDGTFGFSVDFERGADRKWKARKTSDFKAAFWSRTVEPELPKLLSENGLLPRTQWFGKHRIQIGDSVPLGGESIALLFGQGAGGSVTLTFESTGAVAGHPCGIFSISGNYRRKAALLADGTLAEEDVTIESGKVWLSLLHPLVLREELETVQTRISGSRGGASARLQGEVWISNVREWKER